MDNEFNKLLIECINTREVEREICILRRRIKEIDKRLQAGTDTAARVALEREWVEAHMHILNFQYLSQMRLDAILEQC